VATRELSLERRPAEGPWGTDGTASVQGRPWTARTLKLLKAVPEDPHPDPSCLFHWVRADAYGYIVTDVWKDKAAFDKFFKELARSPWSSG
jgi:hypothetical protein